MSAHTQALVPAGTGLFDSLDLYSRGRGTDIGLVAEALIYYERVIVSLSDPTQFADILKWFVSQQRYDLFIKLCSEGTLIFQEYSFQVGPVNKINEDRYHILNFQFQGQEIPNSFERRYLYSKVVEDLKIKGRHRAKLYSALRDRVIESKSIEFSSSVVEARKDTFNPERSALIVQTFVDDLFRLKNLGKPPKIECTVSSASNGVDKTVSWNVDLAAMTLAAGLAGKWHKAAPMAAAALSNRYLQTASTIESDLYLGQPMSMLVGDKLYDSISSIKSSQTIENLKERVEFPDVRYLVNNGRISIDELIKIRSKSHRFRAWLQKGADRNRDEIIAYHGEASKASGFSNVAGRALNIFGVFGSGALSAAAAASISGPDAALIGGAVGSIAGGAGTYLADIGARLQSNWKPIVFGEWLSERVKGKDLGRG